MAIRLHKSSIEREDAMLDAAALRTTEDAFPAMGLGEVTELSAPMPRVLVGIRDHAFRRIIASVLGEASEVIEACTPDDVLFEVRRSTVQDEMHRPIHAAVLDARKDPDAVLETLERVRRTHGRIALVVLTGHHADETFVEATQRLGAHLVKVPLRSHDLHATVQSALRAR